ncbi:BrnT family toxin [Pseudolabrys taiwanensis]|uniref:BrnT family toxin n=1 Tax=Pseudolabrys taiwanensis TaxID=331696 RepID=A0A345ZWY2_9HYPH|nr:BrnT family toxin [Pseudolabrys taiwanensis]AXK81429.1 BrnT family toxin [Pseudolabrys taiwanensis]
MTSFEWDETKRTANVQKHGIDFADAALVFNDPAHLIYRSQRHTGEERFVAIGTVGAKIIAVIFTERGDNVRIISARTTRRIERELYGR